MHRKLGMGSVRRQTRLRTHPNQHERCSQFTLRLTVDRRRVRFVPAEKREEFIKILDDLMKRTMVLINARRTPNHVRLRATEVLKDLINASYTMVRDIEVEELERETEELEAEAKHPQTANQPKEGSTKPPEEQS